MVVTKEAVSKALLTGVGAGYLQKVKTEATSSQGLTYDEKTYEVFAIDKVAFKGQIKEKTVYLSNIKARDIVKFSSVEMTVDIGFFPDGFLEEMSGMTKLANGVYVQGDSPRYKQLLMKTEKKLFTTSQYVKSKVQTLTQKLKQMRKKKTSHKLQSKLTQLLVARINQYSVKSIYVKLINMIARNYYYKVSTMQKHLNNVLNQEQLMRQQL